MITGRTLAEATDFYRRARRPLRIGLFGLFGCGNFGNDGSLEAMIQHLRSAHADADLVTICAGPEIVTRLYCVRAIPIIKDIAPPPTSRWARQALTLPTKLVNFARALKETRKLDALIMPGTGLLDDFTSGVLGIPVDLFLWCLAARITGTQIMMVSVGAGPIVHPLSRWLMTSAARLATFRSYRDQTSKTFLTRLELDTTSDPIYPDIAFSLAAPRHKPPELKPGRLVVGLGLMNYRGWHSNRTDSETLYQTYLDELTEFAMWLIGGGHGLRLMIGDDVDRETAGAFMKRLKRAAGPAAARAVLIEDARTLHDVMAAMARTDVVVATRFHNIVCALKAGRPVLSIGYSEKNRSLLSSFGLSEKCLDIDTIEAVNLIALFEAIVAERSVCGRRITETLEKLEHELQEQYRLIDRTLRGAPRQPPWQERVLATLKPYFDRLRSLPVKRR